MPARYPLMLTYSERRSFARHGAATINATVDAAVASVRAQEAAERVANIAAYNKRTAPVPYSTEQLNAATHVRTSTGWHRVARVNAKSVTVHTAFSWTDRHELPKILEVRTIGENRP